MGYLFFCKHRCIQAKGEGASECDKFARYYRSLCPTEWVCNCSPRNFIWKPKKTK